MPHTHHRRHLAQALAGILTALSTLAFVGRRSASPAAAARFRGVDWARLGDNIRGGRLVLHGSSGSDG